MNTVNYIAISGFILIIWNQMVLSDHGLTDQSDLMGLYYLSITLSGHDHGYLEFRLSPTLFAFRIQTVKSGTQSGLSFEILFVRLFFIRGKYPESIYKK